LAATALARKRAGLDGKNAVARADAVVSQLNTLAQAALIECPRGRVVFVHSAGRRVRRSQSASARE